MNWQPIARIGLTVALSALAGGAVTHQTLSTPTAQPVPQIASNTAPVGPVTVLPVDFSKLKIPACPACPACPSLSIDGVKR